MKANVTIEGLDSLRRRAGAASRTIDKELRPALRSSGQLVRDEARGRAPGRVLQPSIQFRLLSGGLTVLIGSIAKSAYSIEVGRRVGETAPIGLLLRWVRRKNLVPRAVQFPASRFATSAERGVARRRRASSDRSRLEQERRVAWGLVQAIRRRGTREQPFLMPSVPPQRNAIQSLLRQAIARATRAIARG